MKTTRKASNGSRSVPRRLVVTLGELISAAYDAVPAGVQRSERALELLTRSPLSRRITPHVVFVR